MHAFSSDKRTHFFERSGIPLFDSSYSLGSKDIFFPYMLYTSHPVPRALVTEIQNATIIVAETFSEVAKRIHSWNEDELKKWGFADRYAKYLTVPWDEVFCMRVGWVHDNGQLKLVEINSQTPSVWLETELGNKRLAEEFGQEEATPASHENLKRALNQAIAKQLATLPRRSLSPTVGFVTCNNVEDLDTMRLLASFCEYDYEVLHEEHFDFTKDENIPFNRETGKILDAIVLWYPLEWMKDLEFANGDDFETVMFDGLKRKSFALVQTLPSFFIQCKGVLAYITEHADEIFTGHLIDARQYFPQTYLSPEHLGGKYFAKPIWGREGRGAFIMNEGEKVLGRYQEHYYAKQDKVYQELLTLPKLDIEDRSISIIYEAWAYRNGNHFVPGEIGLRGSEHPITDDYSYYIPMGVKKEE